jgi:hypothetical protein
MRLCRNRYGQREPYLHQPNLSIPKGREDRPRLFRLEDRLAPAVLVPPFRQVDLQRLLLPLVLEGLDRSSPSKERTQSRVQCFRFA